MNNNYKENLLIFKKELDSISPTFCAHKWYYSTIHLWKGTTQSCFHNPGHQINLEEIMTNPSAMHNTNQKFLEREMMKRGEKPLGCQFCWTMEENDKTSISDRVTFSNGYSPELIKNAIDNLSVNPIEIELAFEKTCQLSCSYCNQYISSTWEKDIKKHGSYLNLKTDHRRMYAEIGDEPIYFKNNDINPITEKFFEWWKSDLHKDLKSIHMTGGEPTMSGSFWRFLDCLKDMNFKKHNVALEAISVETNLSYKTEIIEKLIDYSASIPVRFNLLVSLENIGEKSEFVRSGLDFELFEKNLDFVVKSNKFHLIYFLSTLGNPSIDGFLEFLNWRIEKAKQYNNFNTKFNGYVNYVRIPTFQSMVVLPTELKEIYSNQIKTFNSNENNTMYFTKNEIIQYERLSNYLIEVNNPHKEFSQNDQNKINNKLYDQEIGNHNIQDLRKDFKYFFEDYSRRRNKNFVEVFPNLKEWYNTL